MLKSETIFLSEEEEGKSHLSYLFEQPVLVNVLEMFYEDGKKWCKASYVLRKKRFDKCVLRYKILLILYFIAPFHMDKGLYLDCLNLLKGQYQIEMSVLAIDVGIYESVSCVPPNKLFIIIVHIKGFVTKFVMHDFLKTPKL